MSEPKADLKSPASNETHLLPGRPDAQVVQRPAFGIIILSALTCFPTLDELLLLHLNSHF